MSRNVFFKGLVVVLLFYSVVTAVNGKSKEIDSKPVLALKAGFDKSSVEIPSEIRPDLMLVNISDKPLKLEYMKPLIVVPEIWDLKSNKRISNAPAFVYDQICTRQETLLYPGKELQLFSLPILIAKQSPSSCRTDRLRGFWTAQPGSYVLKYSVQLKNFLPGECGELHAGDIKINVKASTSVKDAIEELRNRIPEAKTISEANGVSIPDKSGQNYTLTRLEAASHSVPCKTRADCEVLMRYLEDDDLKIRFIACSALEKKLKAHPNGMSMSEIEGKNAWRHENLINRFRAKINVTFKDQDE